KDDEEEEDDDDDDLSSGAGGVDLTSLLLKLFELCELDTTFGTGRHNTCISYETYDGDLWIALYSRLIVYAHGNHNHHMMFSVENHREKWHPGLGKGNHNGEVVGQRGADLDSAKKGGEVGRHRGRASQGKGSVSTRCGGHLEE
ncbi:hypothetical protein PanWU01x14_075380, partial [Parasponia andersonii]